MTTATTAEPSASPAAEQALAAAFDSKPNPARLRLFGATKQAHDALRMALKAGRALSLLVGHDGVGKSTLMQRLGEELGGREALSIYLPNSHMALDDVLRACCEGMGVPAAADSRHARLAAIARYAGEVNRRAIMFFVDNAHTYSNAALLDFAALAAFDTGTPVVYQVVLAGPPSLEEYLEFNLQQVRGRVSAIVHMAPLDIEDVEAYVRFRLEAAGGGSDIFTSDLLHRIARKSYGVPGLINELCTYALSHPIEDVLARLEPDPPPIEVEVEDSAEAVKDQAKAQIDAPPSAEPPAAAAAADLAPAREPAPSLEAPPAAPDPARGLEPAPDIESPAEPVAAVQPTHLTPSATAPTPAPATAAAPIAIPDQATPEGDRVAVVSPPPEPEPSKSAVPAPNVEVAPPSVAKAAEREVASSDHEQGPIEEPATMLIDDAPNVEAPPPVISAPSAAEPPPALADIEPPKRRFSFRASESASAEKPQTYEEWRRVADDERRREGGADPRFEYVPLEPSQPAAPRVLIPPSADAVAQPGAQPKVALDDARPGAVPWVAAVESALMRAAAKRTTDDGAAPTPSGDAANPPHAAKPSSSIDDSKAATAVDASSAESSEQKPAAKKRRFGFF